MPGSLGVDVRPDSDWGHTVGRAEPAAVLGRASSAREIRV